MMHQSLPRAGRVALLLTLAFVVGWEACLRSQDYAPSYNDDEALWAHHRQRVYQSSPAAPVLVGTSRLKFDLDLPAWEAATGSLPVQLAMSGTSPRPVLQDLADDEDFKGTVVVDVMEMLFFSPSGGPFEKRARGNLAYYPNWSIAQRVGFAVNGVLESGLLFLDEERFALRCMLERLPVPNRPGVFALPPFPIRFTRNDLNRQTHITEAFVADTALQREQQQIWWHALTKAPRMPVSDSTMNRVFAEVRTCVAKIKARGGKVVFVRMPSGGPMREIERQAFPRANYWDRLLRENGVPGIHFEDYPALARLSCIEWSHLAPAEAKMFTRAFIPILEAATGWTVQKATALSPAAAHTSSSSTATSH